jgi:hypothetical protein
VLVPTLLAERAPTQLGGTVLSVLRFGWFCIGAMAHADRSQSWPRRTPSGSCATQAPRERRLNVCRQEFNHERPHEALDEDTRAASYTPFPRPLPARLPPLEHPDRFEVRYVSANGCIRWKGRWAPSGSYEPTTPSRP